MSGLKIVNQKGVLVVDSQLVAERLKIQHRTFFRTITSYQDVIEQAFGSLRFENAVRSRGTGNAPKFVYLTEDQATFLMTLSRNTPEVVQCKIDLVKSFSAAKELIRSAAQQTATSIDLGWYIREEPMLWEQMFPTEWIALAQEITGWSWNFQCMSKFVNAMTYDYFPDLVRERLDEVNPLVVKDGQRIRRETTQHERLTDECREKLTKHIENTELIMKTVVGLAGGDKTRYKELLSGLMILHFGKFNQRRSLSPASSRPIQLSLIEVRPKVDFIIKAG